jgi:hypothetical protein
LPDPADDVVDPFFLEIGVLDDLDPVIRVRVAGGVLAFDGADALHPGTTDTTDADADTDTASKAIPKHTPQPAGAASALAQQTVMLRQSRRFGGKLGQLALAVNAGDDTAALALLQDGPNAVLHQSPEPHVGAVLRLAVQGRAGAPACYADYLRLVQLRRSWMEKGYCPSDVTDLQAQIMAVCDIYDALIAMDRPYKKALPHSRAMSILEAEVSEGKLEPLFFNLFRDREIFKLVLDNELKVAS